MDLKAVSVALLSFALLAGCSDGPPAGVLTDTNFAHPVEGTATITMRAFKNPVHESTMGQVPEDQCISNDAPAQFDDQKCVPANTTISGHVMALPMPDASGYELWAVNTTAASTSMLATLTSADGQMYDLTYSKAEDTTGKFQQIEIRMGTFTVATAPYSAGTQTFVLAESAQNVTVTGTYKGKELTATVSGLPEGSTYTGYLYFPAATAGGMPMRDMNQSFAITNGANVIMAKQNVGDYVEFHIHVGTSAINLYQAKLE